MSTVTITKASLRALLDIAPKAALRERTCVVAVDYDRQCLAVTDGYRVAVVHLIQDCDGEENWTSYKRADCETAYRAASKASDLIVFDGGKIRTGGIAVSAQPAHTKFPELKAIIPGRTDLDNRCSPNLDPAYLSDAAKLGKAVCSIDTSPPSALTCRLQTGTNGLSPILLQVSCGKSARIDYVIMPMRA